MNIAIIEKGHFEVAYTLLSIFDTGENKITVFIDRPSYHQLSILLQEKTSRYTWIIQGTESNRKFIQTLFNHIGSHHFDLLYFNTIADNFIQYAWHINNNDPVKMIMNLHDVNGFFRYRFSWSIRRVVRYIGKRKLIRIIPCFNVLSATLFDHLRQKLPGEKKIFNLPGSFFNPAGFTGLEYHKQDAVKITVPGSVDIRRRDYNLVFDLLQEAAKNNVPVIVTLLGGFSKKFSGAVQSWCRQWLQTAGNLRIYETGPVEQDEFDRVMNDSHFIWMPLHSVVIVTDGTREEYGTSISSGNTGDVIRFARPSFAPRHFKLESGLETSCCRYDNVAGLISLLKGLNTETYKELLTQAVIASGGYTIDKIIEKNKALYQYLSGALSSPDL